jgi:tRNA1Val (adenine37-N6)-methyltransferase
VKIRQILEENNYSMARNSFFQFKQFKVNQDKCAMKVCTDACVFGAWVSVEKAENILDIGTGTGLLSLMSAQRNKTSRIAAVELDAEACEQARENVKNSPFHNRIQVFHSAIQDFAVEEKFDCVISNPPFFQADLKSPDPKINLAHHAGSLSFNDLLQAAERLLRPTGNLNILLPVEEGFVFQDLAERSGWFMSRKLTLFHQNGKKPFRALMRFNRDESAVTALVNTELCIYEEDGKTYHPEFKKLLQGYYLIF